MPQTEAAAISPEVQAQLRKHFRIRWLTPNEIISLDDKMRAAGWPPINPEFARVKGIYNDDDELVEVLAIQMIPILGALLRVKKDEKDNGSLTRMLAADMEAYLKKEDARGLLCIAESPVTEKLCERVKMKRIEHPVYMWVNEEA